jgi:hypothetical protein
VASRRDHRRETGMPGSTAVVALKPFGSDVKSMLWRARRALWVDDW